MKDLVAWLVKQIVNHPNEVRVEESQDSNNVQLMLSVHREDMGRVIGKAGKIIKAIRNLVKIKAIKEQKLVNLQLAESDLPQES